MNGYLFQNNLVRKLGALSLMLLTFGLLKLSAHGQGAPNKAKTNPPKPTLGLLVNDPQACKGYTLIAPSSSNDTYLIDMEGRVVNSWKSDCNPGLSAYLLENGNLLRTRSR